MDKRSLTFTAVALGIACTCSPAFASGTANERRVGVGIHEVADQELADMRGRYVVGNSTVLWFGVEMISTWQTNSGQTLQSALTLGLNFSKNANQPQVTFVPTVTIATLSNALSSQPAPSQISRSVQSGGIANVGGLVQSVQIAGDHNAASNITSLNIQNSGNAMTGHAAPSSQTPSSNHGASSTAANGPMVDTGSAANLAAAGAGPAPSGGQADLSSSATNGNAIPTGRVAISGNATASATYSDNSAQVSLSVAGQGSVSQWIHQGNLGQTIALTADNQIVTNQMIVSMVTQSLANASQLSRSLAQSLNLSHTNSR